MTLTDIGIELQAIESELRDLKEVLDDADDIGHATRIRGAIRARLRRLEELELDRARLPSRRATILGAG